MRIDCRAEISIAHARSHLYSKEQPHTIPVVVYWRAVLGMAYKGDLCFVASTDSTDSIDSTDSTDTLVVTLYTAILWAISWAFYGHRS